MISLSKHCLILSLLSSVTAPVAAQQAGDWVFRMGLTMMEPRESSTDLRLDSAAFLIGGRQSRVGVDSAQQLGLTLDYFLSDVFSVELLVAAPFSHDIVGTGALAGLPLAETKQLPPTLSLVYHIDTPGRLRPYLGAGINYTRFFQDNVTTVGNATLGGLGLRDGNIHLDHSLGLALQGGIDYHLDGDWLLNASLRWIDIDTTATLAFTGGRHIEADVALDPLVYTLAVGLHF